MTGTHTVLTGMNAAYVLVKQGKVLLSFLLPACAEYRPPFFPLLKLCKRSRTAPSRFCPAPSGHFSRPSPPIRAVISSMRSSGKGGSHKGFRAMLISFMGLSSAATLLELSAPHLRQRWMMAHSPLPRTHTAIGSMMPPQSASRSPGSISTCRLERQLGQWLRWSVPAASGVTNRPHTLQVKLSLQGWFL